MIPERILDLLACPACESRPKVDPVADGLRCPRCGRTYPIEDGIPIMLVERANQEDGGNAE